MRGRKGGGGRERNKGAKPEKVSLVVADVSSEGLFFVSFFFVGGSLHGMGGSPQSVRDQNISGGGGDRGVGRGDVGATHTDVTLGRPCAVSNYSYKQYRRASHLSKPRFPVINQCLGARLHRHLSLFSKRKSSTVLHPIQSVQCVCVCVRARVCVCA